MEAAEDFGSFNLNTNQNGFTKNNKDNKDNKDIKEIVINIKQKNQSKEKVITKSK